jgi:hypothetical protein
MIFSLPTSGSHKFVNVTVSAFCVIHLLLTVSSMPLAIAGESRQWTNSTGRTIEAEFIGFDAAANKVTIKLANGKEVMIGVDTLSEADRTWLSERQRKLDEAAAAVKANAGKIVQYQSEGGQSVSYHVYWPAGFDPSKPPAMIILFSPGGSGKGILGSVKDACEKLGWIGVGCDTFRNNSDEAILDAKWRNLLPHIEKTVPHNPDLLYLGGSSGGALRAYDYSESTARPWKGILAFGGWLGGKPTLKCASKMAVAIVNGDADKNANANIPQDEKVFRSARCNVKTFSFPGGHTIAPPEVIAEALEWLNASTVPGNRLSAGKRSPTPRDPDLSKVSPEK